MYLRDVRVGDDDEGQIAHGLDARSETDGKDGQGEIGRFVECFGGEWWVAIAVSMLSVKLPTANQDVQT